MKVKVHTGYTARPYLKLVYISEPVGDDCRFIRWVTRHRPQQKSKVLEPVP